MYENASARMIQIMRGTIMLGMAAQKGGYAESTTANSKELTFSSRRQSLRRRSTVVNTAQPILNTKRILSIMRRYSIDSNADKEQTEVCCEYCDEWSVLPDGISSNDSPGEWYCNACKKQEC